MSALLSAAPPVTGAQARADPPPPAAARPPPAVRTETARAVQPAESAGRGLDIRFEDARGRPVGPPPAFQVSLLQAMQESALSRRPAAPGLAEPAPDWPGPGQVDRKV